MKTDPEAIPLGATVAARIREFRRVRGISEETLVRSAKLSPAEVQLLAAESEEMTRDMLERIAEVFDVHPAVLCMNPGEHAITNLLETDRDLPKESFQKLAGELISKGFYNSRGKA